MRVLLFAGKGGVGKTTLAAATASGLAEAGRKVLVVSTDPAHSLADALDVAPEIEPTEVEPGLWAAHIDGRTLLDGSWDTLRTHLTTLLAGAGVDEITADELTVLPGLEELLAMAEVHRLAMAGPWDVLVVDCAPTAESLRLLALPEAAGRALERLFPTHRRVVRGLLAGLAGVPADASRWDGAADALGRLAEHLDALRALLADRVTTSVQLVFTPERVVAAETRRTVTALALQGVRVDAVVANRLVPDPGPRARGVAAEWLRVRHREQRVVLDALRRDLPDTPVLTVGHRAAEPVGRAGLRELAVELGTSAEDLLGVGDPAASADPGFTVLRTAGHGVDPESEFTLRLPLPLVDPDTVDLARIDDDLAITVGGHRRMVALPAVLRRCTVTAAEAGDGALVVRFRPDPELWMR